MRIHNYILALACSITFFACNDSKKGETTPSPQEETTLPVKPSSKAEVILNQTIDAHGGDLYNSANYSFVFRDNTYHFKNDNQNYEYTKISKKDNTITIDVLKNGKLYRTINEDTVSLNEKQIKIRELKQETEVNKKEYTKKFGVLEDKLDGVRQINHKLS